MNRILTHYRRWCEANEQWLLEFWISVTSSCLLFSVLCQFLPQPESFAGALMFEIARRYFAATSSDDGRVC